MISIITSICLIAVLGIFILLSIYSTNSLKNVASTWNNYSYYTASKGALITELLEELGYGGMIHNFKNYVLLQKPEYLRKVQNNFKEIFLILKEIENMQSGVAEKGAINNISKVIKKYQENLIIAEDMIKRGASPEQIDAIIKTDDESAIASLEMLELIIRTKRNETSGELHTHLQKMQTVFYMTVAIMTVILGSLMTLGLWFTKYRLIIPLKQLLEAINHMNEGGSEEGILVDENSEDEFGALGVSFNKMVRNIGQSEKALRSSNKKLRSSMKRAELILNSTAEGIFGLDKEGKIVFLNPAASEMTGWTPQELKGKQPHGILHLTKENGTPYKLEESPIYSSYTNGELHHIETEVFSRKNGTTFPVEYYSMPIFDEDGAIEGAVVTFLNITDRKDAERELLRTYENLQKMVQEQTADIRLARDAAEAASRAKTEFLANISHELRTPMHAILGYSDLGLRKVESGPRDKLNKFFSAINESGSRLLSLLNNLLDLSKMETGAIKFNLGKHDLRPLIDKVCDQVAPLVTSKRLTLDVVEESDTVGQITLDPDKITQVLWNLLSNAIKFSPNGGNITIVINKTEIQAGRRKTDDNMVPAVALSVVDEGVGIPEDELEAVFDKFIQSSKTKDGSGGTGLGLAISKEIILGHKGKIWAENNLEIGASLTFVIPIDQPVSD